MFWRRTVSVILALLAARFVAPQLCSCSAGPWLRDDVAIRQQLADHLLAFEDRDDVARREAPKNRFAGEWALVTHQMTALGLGQVVLAHPQLKDRYLPAIGRAATSTKRFCLPANERRDWSAA